MSKKILLFNGVDSGLASELWETDGTVAGTFEVTPGFAANVNGLDPQYITAYNNQALFEGQDTSGAFGLWVTNGTAAGTVEIGGLGSAAIANANPTGLGPGYFQVYNGEVLFRGEAGVAGDDVPGLWITNGTVAGTTEIGGAGNVGIANAYGGGLLPSNPDFTLLNGLALFNGRDSAGNVGLWVTDGTATGTFELAPISGAAVVGTPGSDVQPQYMAVLGNEVLFDGADQQDTPGSLWMTNGTAAGTVEIGGQGNAAISGSPNGFTNQFTSELPLGIQPSGLTTFGSEALFAGYDSTLDSAGYYADTDALWMTNGTAGGTTEIGGLGNAGINDINPAVDGGIFWGGSIEYPDFTVLGNEALFVGYDQDGHVGLWETNGSANGTVEIGGLGNAGINGGLSLSDSQSPDFTLYNGELLFYGYTGANQLELWSTNGTVAGTHPVVAVGGSGPLTAVTLGDDYTGGGKTVTLSAGGEASLLSTGGDFDSVTGSSGTIDLLGAQSSVIGGGDIIYFLSGSGNVASLFDTGGVADTVNGSNGTVNLSSAQAAVEGGGDTVYLDGSSSDVASLANTSGSWDAVVGNSGTVNFDSAQASIIGGGDTVDFTGGSGNAALLANTGANWDLALNPNQGALYLDSAMVNVVGGGASVVFYAGAGNAAALYNSGGSWDGVYGSNGSVYIDSALANVVGGGDTVDFVGGSGNAALLANTGANWDLALNPNQGVLYLDSAMVNVVGGGASVDFYAGSGNAAALYNSGGAWDSVSGNNGAAYLENAQANVVGGGDTVDFIGGSGNAALLANTGANWDLVLNGAGGTVYLDGALASFVGGGASIDFYGGTGNVAALVNTGASADTIFGASGALYLSNAQANVQSNGDYLNFSGGNNVNAAGTNEYMAFAAAIGNNSITGFGSTDAMQFAASDFANFGAMMSDTSQQGANTVIFLDAGDNVTLVNTLKSSLVTSQFHFV